MVFLDTHIAAWLYEKNLKLISAQAKEIINNEELYISPMVFLELEYLYEIEKLRIKASTIIEYLADRVGLRVDDISFQALINQAPKEKWTRDPFDRLIVAQAKYRQNAVLISRDKMIQQHYKKAIG